MKIGIFGGSFNPVHKVHEQIGIELLNRKIIDKIIYVPTNNYYKKEGLIDLDDRYNMLKLMISNKKNFMVSKKEEDNKLNYTYETLDYYQKKYPNAEIYFICGMDNIKEITTWKNYQHILSNYKWLVICRNKLELKEQNEKLYKNIKIIDLKTSDTSSTLIRNLLKQKASKEKLLKYIDKEVMDYILNNHLYED